LAGFTSGGTRLGTARVAALRLPGVPGPQLLLQDLAGGGDREGIDELERARLLEGGEALGGERDQLVRGRLRARLQCDDRVDRLAPPLVRDADRGRLGHGRMLVER